MDGCGVVLHPGNIRVSRPMKSSKKLLTMDVRYPSDMKHRKAYKSSPVGVLFPLISSTLSYAPLCLESSHLSGGVMS